MIEPNTIASARDHWQSVAWRNIVISMVAWVSVLVMGTMCLLRIIAWDANYYLLWWNAFTPYVYLPAYLTLAWSVWRRERCLWALSAILVAFHLACCAPDVIAGAKRLASNPRSEPAAHTLPNSKNSLRLFYANVSAENRSCRQMCEEMKQANPDLIVLIEYTRAWDEALSESGIKAQYPYSGKINRPNPSEIAIYSRHPIGHYVRKWVRRTLHVSFSIELIDREVEFLALHAPRPIAIPGRDYFDYWSSIIQVIQSFPRPLVVLGDFNTTQHSKWYHRVRQCGLESVHELCGRGYATTWPNGRSWLPPIRIDQAMVSPDIVPISVREGEGVGSDHKPLVLEFRLKDPEEPADEVGHDE